MEDEQDSPLEVEEAIFGAAPVEPKWPQTPLTHEQLIASIQKLTGEINEKIEQRSKLRKAVQSMIGKM